jgi:hypothetical protein
MVGGVAGYKKSLLTNYKVGSIAAANVIQLI